MNRRALLLVALLGGVLASAGALEAQTRFYFGARQDTALGLIPGKEMRVPVRGDYFCPGTGVTARLTIRYDTSVVRLTGVDAGALDTLVDTTSSSPGLFSVRGQNPGYVCASDTALFTLRVALDSAATGTFLWSSVDSLVEGGVDVTMSQRTSIAQICRATAVYGDVDGNGRIDSRDALIVLSNAVGLPVTGFNLAAGDVDRDGLANSRDALLMLSYTIGLWVPTTLQLGEGAPVACPGTSAPGEAVVFKRNGSGIELLAANATTPTLVPRTVPADSAPRLASSGTQIIYSCQDSVYPYYTDICSINTDGTGLRRLTTAYYYTLPDLNPNGFRFLYQYGYNGPLYWGTTSDSVRSPVYFPPASYPLYPLAAAWSRDSAHIAYTSGGFYTLINSVYSYQARGLWKADTAAAPTFVQLDTAYTAAYAPPRWSPAGDSVAYVRNDGRIWAVPATGVMPAIPFTNFRGMSGNGITSFDWGPQGLIFSLDAAGNGQHPSIWLLPNQNAPIQRITAPATGDWQPSFRRNP